MNTKTTKVYQKQWRTLNKERFLGYQKKYRENNKKKTALQRKSFYDKNKQYWKQWVEQHYDEVLLRNKVWRQNNIEKVHQITLKNKKKNKKAYKIYNKKWSQENPNKIAVYNHKRRMGVMGGDLTEKEWVKIKERFEFRCAICNELKKLTLDHIIPINKGGKHTKKNIQPLCQSCNSRKKDKIIILKK